MENFEKEIKREAIPEVQKNPIEQGKVLENEPLQENAQAKQPEITETDMVIPVPESEKAEDSVEFNNEEIESYLRLAQEKGLDVAIKAAESANDPRLLDKVHDALTKMGF